MDRLMKLLILLGHINLGTTLPFTTYIIVSEVWETITSANYPGFYPNNHSKSWEITTPEPTDRISVEVLDFDLESSPPSCLFDKVIVFDGSVFEGRYCGRSNNNNAKNFTSDSDTLRFDFTTDDSSRYRGFKCRVKIYVAPSTAVAITTIIQIVVGVVVAVVAIVVTAIVVYLVYRSSKRTRCVQPRQIRQAVPPQSHLQTFNTYDNPGGFQAAIPPAFNYIPPNERDVYDRTGLGFY